MAGHIPPSPIEPLTAPQHFVPPTARERRSQAVHRLQVGLFGLCAMLLIVGLANVIRDKIKIDAPDPIQSVVAADEQPAKPASDPLADIGVVPAAEPTPSPTPDASPSSEASMAPGLPAQ